MDGYDLIDGLFKSLTTPLRRSFEPCFSRPNQLIHYRPPDPYRSDLTFAM